MSRNLATSLKRRSRGRAFDLFDRLPPELRAWLAGAALPWSPRSISRIWPRLLREERGSITAALTRLDAAERRMLAKDCPKVWGQSYPLEIAVRPDLANSRRIGVLQERL